MKKNSVMTGASQSAEPIVRIRGLRKAFGNHVVLNGIDFDVLPSQVVVVIGPSGSGKSTFLRCCNGLEQPEGGTVEICGRTLVQDGRMLPDHDLNALREEVGMVFQSFNLFPHLTVLRNVSLAQIRTLGRSAKEADARSLQLLERVGLADKAQHYPARCSGGQQQRIAIARALALDPELMLFDEPTSALDPELGLEVLAVMKELAGEGMSMIVVTHEMHFAETVSDRVVVMADGRIIEHGPSQRVMREPEHERVIQFLQAVRNR